jgi:hypothetical protein
MLGRLLHSLQETFFSFVTLLGPSEKPLRANVNFPLAVRANNVDFQCNQKSSLGLLKVGSLQLPTVSLLPTTGPSWTHNQVPFEASVP